MRRILVVSTPAILEARNLAAWITRERIPGVRIAPSRGEWGVFAPASHAERARKAFRKVVAANNPGGHRVVFKIRPTDPYTTMKKRYTFGRGIQIADMLVKGIVLKAAVLDGKGKVRFVAFKKTGRAASNPGMDALADAAVMMAARGARQYLDVHKLTADPAALTSCLKSWVKIKFPEALNDAKAAISAGMHAVAEQTFAATMRLAGIEAAKEAARAPGTNRARRNQPNKPRFYQDSMGKIHDWNTGAIAALPVSPVVVMSYRTKPPGLFKTWRAGGERHWDYLGPSAERSPRANRNGRSYKRNVSIESKWPGMTDRQRREALRIIGIQEDIAELWSGKSWGTLSSVVKTLLARSWRHGSDTTKIRRVPVGAR